MVQTRSSIKSRGGSREREARQESKERRNERLSSAERKIFPNTEATPLRLRASLFRSFVLADYVTMLNAVCGVSSVFLCLNYLENNRNQEYLMWAFTLIPLALIFDIMDGWVARKRKSHSPWGSDLDSLADVVSFVVTPAVLGFTLGLRGMWDSIILCFFVFCGIARLARFNVTSSQLGMGVKVPYYEGFPVPTSLIIVGLWFYAWYIDSVFEHVWGGVFKFIGRDFHPFSIVYLIWGCLFVSSSVRIPKP